MLQGLAKYSGHEAKHDLAATAHSAFIGMSTSLAAAKEKRSQCGNGGTTMHNGLESHMRCLSRALAKARSTSQMCRSAEVDLQLPKENYDECEALFNSIALEMLNEMKANGAAMVEQSKTLQAAMTINGEYNWTGSPTPKQRRSSTSS